MKAYRFRIYPNKEQTEKMERHLEISRMLWNRLLEATKERYDTKKKFYTKTEMQKMTNGSCLYSQTSQSVAHRLHRAIWTKVEMNKRCLKWGFPRFKKRGQLRSLYYPQFGFKLGDSLKVTPFGELEIVQHRPIEGRIKTLTLKHMPSGKWFAVFVTDAPLTCTPHAGKGSVGVDLGLKTFATLSDGRTIGNPRFFKKHEDRLALEQRRLSKKNRGGINRQKARVKVAKIHEKIADSRLDFLHKAANMLIRSYSFIVLEKLNPHNMSQGWLGKSINDASWSTFTNILRYKAESAGCRLVFVDPNGTTQECSVCHEKVRKGLGDRMHECPYCGLSIDRDLNASKNILIRATVGTAGSNASGNGTAVPSMKEESHFSRG